MRKKGSYGGIFAPIINSILHEVARNILVQAKEKKAYRGGARIGLWRRVVQGKDRHSKERR